MIFIFEKREEQSLCFPRKSSLFLTKLLFILYMIYGLRLGGFLCIGLGVSLDFHDILAVVFQIDRYGTAAQGVGLFLVAGIGKEEHVHVRCRIQKNRSEEA